MGFVAYHIVWHTYGSWLPGDERGWVDRRSPEVQAGRPGLWRHARDAMTEEPVILTVEQRKLVASVCQEHCRIREWLLHAINVLKTHVHAVIASQVSAGDGQKSVESLVLPAA
jgi:hypothetical protein